MPRQNEMNHTQVDEMYAVPKGLTVRLHHMHRGNSSRSKRHGHEYVTRAVLFDTETGMRLTQGMAFCARGDTPSRKLGRDIAVGRALKAYGLL